MSCKTCGAPTAPGKTSCELAWACDVRANSLLCLVCRHPFWEHGAEGDGRCWKGSCACLAWGPGQVGSRLCIACGGVLGDKDTGNRHDDLSWCQEWEFWIECGNCRHPWNAHDLETSSCLGVDDRCKCTTWKPVPKKFDMPPQTLREYDQDDPEEDLEDSE